MIIVFSLIQLHRINAEKEKTIFEFKELQSLVNEDISQNNNSEIHSANSAFQELKEKNNDFIGWITVNGTNIDYPVVRNNDDPEFYLNHNFNKEEDKHGIPFASQSSLIPDGDNIIIYGHHMRDGTMFSELKKFTDSDFCEENHLIELSTINTTATYEVIMVFKISESDTEKFPYHTFTSFNNITANEYLSKAQEYAIWSSKESVTDNTKLLTLSTCEYSLKNGRLVIIAKKQTVDCTYPSR